MKTTITYTMKFIIEPINDTDCRITGVDCSALQGKSLEEMTIPATVEQDGKVWQVKQVGPDVCFTNKLEADKAKYASLRRLKKIVISEGIEAIEGIMNNHSASNADQRGNSETLEEVALPSTLKTIGTCSFAGCRQLVKVNIPEGVEEIGAQAFGGCESLPLFQWPKGLKRVDLTAFKHMPCPIDENGTNTYILDVPDTIEEITGESDYLATIPECRVSAKAWAVVDASKLLKKVGRISIPEGVKKLTALFSYSLYDITLPSTLEEIGESVFEKTKALDFITELPAALKVIGKYAFYGNKSAEPRELRIPSPNVRIGGGAFSGSNVKLTGDDATMSALMGQPGALNGTLVEAIDMPEGATEVDVQDCKELVRLTIPATVKTIKKISYCPELENLEIPSSVTTIGEIIECDKIERLIVPDSVSRIDRISNCASLKMLQLPDSLQELNDVRSLSAQIIASPSVWNLICSKSYALRYYRPKSGELTLPEGVGKLAERLLNDSTVSILNLPKSLKVIESGALEGCKLESIEFTPGSQLKEICREAFAKTALKQLVLPDGLQKLGGEVFKDIETLESVTFPASMTDFGFECSEWGDTTTPFVRCKNLKYVVFLADDPATAVYPPALGKLCDWYVPDHMVDHVKAAIEKAKADYPNAKGIGAKSVKPLSKLTGAKPAKTKPAKKDAAVYTQPVKLEGKMRVDYKFAVAEEDLHMLDNKLDATLLLIRYMRTKLNECAYEFYGPGGYYVGDDLVNPATGKGWHATPKTVAKLDYSDTATLPEGFPADAAQNGSVEQLYAASHPGYKKSLPEVPKYIRVRFDLKVTFDFMIGAKEKFSFNKISVAPEWSGDNWHFGLIYSGRYIHVSSIENTTESMKVEVFNSRRFDSYALCDLPACSEDGIGYEPLNYDFKELPFVEDILKLVK